MEPWLAKLPVWARLRDGDRALKAVRAALGHHSHPNLMVDGNEGIVQVGDAHGITMGLLECLVQDHDGVVDLLPALPTGRITGLRLRGGHVLDLAWEACRLTTATLRAATSGSLRVRSGDTERNITLAAGQVADVFDAISDKTS